jgi:hydroxyquinol 1,2-dioxygenase
MRPAHLHFLACKDGFKTLISQLYVPDDQFIETDVQFGVTRHLIGNYVLHGGNRKLNQEVTVSAGPEGKRGVTSADVEQPPAADVEGPWYTLEHTFVMERGHSRLPRPPITGKASGERPKIPHLA